MKVVLCVVVSCVIFFSTHDICFGVPARLVCTFNVLQALILSIFALGQLTGDIHEEVENHSRVLDRMVSRLVL